ncbi:MAG TPA: hypothetical protein VHI93_04480 [Candidatus Thermoplasmatota archaeon]|nr:hypothetical protein [Candidatus Thermoplasmatota archaeon]
MDILVVLLRFVHIAAAVAWAGSAFFVLSILDPMGARIGAGESGRLARHLVLRSRFALFFPAVAITTVVAGLVLYGYVGGHRLYSMSSASGLVFHAGVLFGILAVAWGGAMEGRTLGQVRRLAERMEGAPTAAQEQELTALQRRLTAHNRVSGVLLLAALFCMATFQAF